MQKTTTFSTILVLALLAARAAWAGPSEDADREAARIATKQATAAFNLGHYDEAASLYEEAYKLVPDPILLYDLGQSYRQANKPNKALTAYRSYLRTASDDAPNRAKVQEWVDELEWTADVQAKAAAQKAAQKGGTADPGSPCPGSSQTRRTSDFTRAGSLSFELYEAGSGLAGPPNWGAPSLCFMDEVGTLDRRRYYNCIGRSDNS